MTDLLDIHNLLTLIHFLDIGTDKIMTSFVNTTDILEQAENLSADSEPLFQCLKQVIEGSNLKLKNLVGFWSDATSVMIGKENEVAAKFIKLSQCENMVIVHCICHRLALTCADAGDDLQLKDFEITMIQLWVFF